MREYRLINKFFDIDLTDYEKLIINTVQQFAPEADVTVYPDRYEVDCQLSQRQTVMIGRALAKTELGRFCAMKPVLFKGKKVAEC